MPSVLVLHGPNLNLLGKRQPEIYGPLSLNEINERLTALGQELSLEVQCCQSNSEGALIDHLHAAHTWAHGVIFNPGAYTHTSVALRDAVSAINLPVIEVHLTNIYARETFRQQSLISPVCQGVISGFGWRSYVLALRALAELLKQDKGAAD